MVTAWLAWRKPPLMLQLYSSRLKPSFASDRRLLTVTGVDAYWMVASSVDTVKPTVGHKTHYTSAAARKNHLQKAIESGQAPTQQLRTRSVSEHFSKPPAATEEQINIFF